MTTADAEQWRCLTQDQKELGEGLSGGHTHRLTRDPWGWAQNGGPDTKMGVRPRNAEGTCQWEVGEEVKGHRDGERSQGRG